MKRVLLPVLLVLAVGVGGASAVRLAGGEETKTITAHFTGVPGLYEGNSVAVLGIQVGRVERIEPHETDVLVTLSVPADLKIPADAGAVIVPASLVTDRFIELTPVYRSGDVMPDGAVIPASRTRTPVEFDDVVTAVSGLAGDLAQIEKGTGAIDTLIGAAAANAKGNGPALSKAIQGASTALSTFASDPSRTTDLVKGLASLAKLLAASQKTIRSFSSTVTEATRFLAAESESMKSALDQTLDLVVDIEAFLRTNQAAMAKGVTGLDATAGTLAARSKEMSEAVDLLPLLFQNVVRAYDPQRKAIRARAELFEGALTLGELTLICKEVSKLPACSTAGDVLSLGSDLGLTELLLGLLSAGAR